MGDKARVCDFGSLVQRRKTDGLDQPSPPPAYSPLSGVLFGPQEEEKEEGGSGSSEVGRVVVTPSAGSAGFGQVALRAPPADQVC